MPRKATVHSDDALVPVAQQTIRITKRNLARVQEQHLFKNVEPLLTEAFESLRRRVRSGDLKAVELAMQVAGIINTSRTPSVVAQFINKNESTAVAVSTTTNDSSDLKVTSFESIVRMLDARDAAERDQPPVISAIDIEPDIED